MRTFNYLFGILAVLLIATGCGKDDEPDVNTEAPVFNLKKSSAVEAVDLGLSVMWSNCNLGASSPMDYGGYFAWGDPTGALWSGEGIGYNDSGYTWNTNNYGGNNPPADISGGALDVVTAHWGDGWRMPTEAEMIELATKCEWTLLEQGGKKWFEVKGPNGHSISMPIAGLYGDDPDNHKSRFLDGPMHTNNTAFYWTSTVSWKQDQQVRGYLVNPGVVTSWAFLITYVENDPTAYYGFRDHLRAFHLSIRPVLNK